MVFNEYDIVEVTPLSGRQWKVVAELRVVEDDYMQFSTPLEDTRPKTVKRYGTSLRLEDGQWYHADRPVQIVKEKAKNPELREFDRERIEEWRNDAKRMLQGKTVRGSTGREGVARLAERARAYAASLALGREFGKKMDPERAVRAAAYGDLAKELEAMLGRQRNGFAGGAAVGGAAGYAVGHAVGKARKEDKREQPLGRREAEEIAARVLRNPESNALIERLKF